MNFTESAQIDSHSVSKGCRISLVFDIGSEIFNSMEIRNPEIQYICIQVFYFRCSEFLLSQKISNPSYPLNSGPDSTTDVHHSTIHIPALPSKSSTTAFKTNAPWRKLLILGNMNNRFFTHRTVGLRRTPQRRAWRYLTIACRWKCEACVKNFTSSRAWKRLECYIPTHAALSRI